MNTRESGRIITKGLLKALMEGLGQGETAIFPISIFVTKIGVNCMPGDPNYDLYQAAMRVSAKRLYPTYIFLDSPINLPFYRHDDPRSFVAQMGCRTRVMANVNGEETSYGRGNLSATTINLPGLALETRSKFGADSENLIDEFYKILDYMLNLCEEQLIDRYKGQCELHGYNMPMTIGENLYLGSKEVGKHDKAEPVFRNGTLVIGYCGLAECLVALIGKHHGESMEAQRLGLDIVKRINAYTTALTEKYNLNFATFATPAESTAGRFVEIDKKKYPIVPGVNDKGYYTNSNHVPVGYNINISDKISIEGPYHKLTTAGNISYVELDGDISENIEAFENILTHMRETGVQYGAVNVPVDRCNFCNYTGVIKEECPRCGYHSDDYYDENIHRIRRITGYLTGDVHNRFNDSKKAEERDRVKHGSPCN
jgi:ribonucleoside-triphosphate reductase